MLSWYQSYFVDTGRSAALWLIIGFLVTFAITRSITLKIRARGEAEAGVPAPVDDVEEKKGLINDIHIGGVHVHHQVWGILLVLVVGMLEFRFQPPSPWVEILAALFGIGAALALDEFALWLHLEDVYWSKEGQKSIDAVLIAVVVGAALLVGVTPVGDVSAAQEQGAWALAAFIVIHVALCVGCMLKGKPITGLVGLPVALFAYVGVIRLAKPDSFWARRWYGPAKMARAQARFADNRSRRLVEQMRERFSPAARD